MLLQCAEAERHLVLPAPQRHGRVHDQALGATDAQIRVDEGHPHVGRNCCVRFLFSVVYVVESTTASYPTTSQSA